MIVIAVRRTIGLAIHPGEHGRRQRQRFLASRLHIAHSPLERNLTGELNPSPLFLCPKKLLPHCELVLTITALLFAVAGGPRKAWS